MFISRIAYLVFFLLSCIDDSQKTELEKRDALIFILYADCKALSGAFTIGENLVFYESRKPQECGEKND